MKRIASIIFAVFTLGISKAQVAINTTAALANPSAMLDISSANKGVLLPRVALTGNTDITTIPSAAVSLLVYNTATAGAGGLAVTPGYYYWSALAWQQLTVSGSSNSTWSLGGNASTTAAQFLGTSDNTPLTFKINNINAGYLGLNGNSYWGLNSGNINAGGYSNVAIGTNSLSYNSPNHNIVAVGDSALFNNGQNSIFGISATQNTAVGSKALFANTNGYFNTATGYQSLYSNTTGYYNTAMGSQALQGNVSGYNNTSVGTRSLLLNTTGYNNTANGFAALFTNTAGNDNTASGHLALFSNTSGFSNVAIGKAALFNNLTAHNIVAVGDSAMYSQNDITAYCNTAVGSKTLFSNIAGFGNTALGFEALKDNTASQNTAVGTNSLRYNSAGTDNTGIGFGSLSATTSGDENTAVGSYALYGNLSGRQNTAVGYNALAISSASYNTAVGTNAMAYNLTGTLNTAVGAEAMFNNYHGVSNTAVGTAALWLNLNGSYNTAFGDQTLSASTGSWSAAFGYKALLNNSTGQANVAVGYQAMMLNTTGNNNTAIGTNAGPSAGGFSNASAIGGYAQTACSNCMVLGSVNGINTATSDVKVGIGVTSPQNSLHVSPNAAGGVLVGTNKNSGGYTNLEMGISSQSNGYSFIQSTQASGSQWGNLALNQAGGNVGIHLTTALSPLHIKQANDAFPVNGGGLRLERLANSNHWEMGTDNGDDLDFSYNGVYKTYLNNTDGTFVFFSDLRLKKDIQLIGSVLPSVMKLQPKTYHYKNNEVETPLSYGFIAQEVEELFPDFVKTKGVDSVKGIKYQNFSVIAIRAIQEQQEMIRVMQQEISELKKKIK